MTADPLPEYVERALEAAVTCTESLMWRAAIDVSRDAAKADLRAVIRRYADERVVEERKACARISDEFAPMSLTQRPGHGSVGDIIRARGDKP